MIGVVSVVVAITVGLATLANWLSFGALCGFMSLNATVVWHFYIKNKNKTLASFVKYLISPLVGFAVCAYIFANMNAGAYKVGGTWLAVGFVYLLYKTNLFSKPAPVLQLDEVLEPEATEAASITVVEGGSTARLIVPSTHREGWTPSTLQRRPPFSLSPSHRGVGPVAKSLSEKRGRDDPDRFGRERTARLRRRSSSRVPLMVGTGAF